MARKRPYVELEREERGFLINLAACVVQERESWSWSGRLDVRIVRSQSDHRVRTDDAVEVLGIMLPIAYVGFT
jgi:hypothetical protein